MGSGKAGTQGYPPINKVHAARGTSTLLGLWQVFVPEKRPVADDNRTKKDIDLRLGPRLTWRCFVDFSPRTPQLTRGTEAGLFGHAFQVELGLTN